MNGDKPRRVASTHPAASLTRVSGAPAVSPAKLAALNGPDVPPTREEVKRIIARMQKKDIYGIFREPVTDDMVRAALAVTPYLGSPGLCAMMREAHHRAPPLPGRALRPLPACAPWGLAEYLHSARCACASCMRQGQVPRCPGATGKLFVVLPCIKTWHFVTCR